MKQQKLLNKTLRYYLFFGLLMALCIVQAFYGVMKKYHIHEIDEYLLLQHDNIAKKSLQTLKISEIPAWNEYNLDQSILPDTGQTITNTFITAYFYSEHEKGNEPFRMLRSPVEIEGGKYILTIRINIYEARKILLSSSVLQLLLFVCLMAVMTLVSGLIHNKLWKPFYKTISLTEQFNIQQNQIPSFQSGGTQEFEQLNRALSTLIANNLQAYKIQKEFTENASHETQTPLAVLRSQLDNLLQQSGLTAEQLQIIQTLYESSSRLTRINKNLLLLAKLDNLQFTDTQTLNVAELLQESISFFSTQAEAQNISLEKQLTDRSFTLNTNKLLLESLVNNLLSNAIRHNEAGGKINVTLESGQLDICNTGTGKPLDNALLFRRFGRENATSQGSGLGLSIVQQICTQNGWKINYNFEDGMHRFNVVFSSIEP